MSTDDELFDEYGILREELVGRAASAFAYRVFLQRFDAKLEVSTLEGQASRFFATKIGLMAPKRYRAAAPIVDLARFAIAAPGRETAIRSVYVRPATTADHDHALNLEYERRATGLGGLARRCATIAEVERTSRTDADALLLAAIFASTHLGPIVDIEGRDIFGVKTARLRLAELTPP